MTPEVKEKVKGKTAEEVRAMIKSKEIIVPENSKERDEFLRYVTLPPDKRDTEVPTASQTPPAAPADGSAGKQSIADDTGKTKWWEELGYGSAEEAIEGTKKIRDLNRQLQTNLDSVNGKEGERGRKMKALEEDNQRILKELDELKKKTTPEITAPEKPKRPNPKEYDDGVLSPDYLTALDKYLEDIDTYNEKLNAFRDQELEKKIQASVPKQESRTEAPVTATGWDKLWNDDIPSFQKKFGAETSVSIREISDALNRANGKTTTDPQEIARAKAFLDTVPKKDMETYGKVRNAIYLAYDIENPNGPTSKYAKGLEGALLDHDMLGEGKPFNIVKPSSLTSDEEKRLREEKQRRDEQSASPIPADKLASGDSAPSATATKDEKTKRYRDLIAAFNVAMRNGQAAANAFKTSLAFEELNKLSVELGLSKTARFTR